MLDKALIEFAEINHLKVSNDSCFGAFENQIININANANGQYVIIVSLQTSNSIYEKINTKENLKSIRKLIKALRITITKKALIIDGFAAGLRFHSKIEKLTSSLIKLFAFISTFQTFQNLKSEQIVLINNIAVIKSDQIIHDEKLELQKESLTIIEHYKGFYISLLGCLLASILLGFFSGLMNEKLQSDFNFFGKAFLELAFATSLYKKYSKGIDHLSKWFIGLSATFGLAIWEVSRYATLLKLKGQSFTIESLYELLKLNLTFESVNGKYNLISLFIIWGFALFFLKRTNNEPFNLIEGEFITQDKKNEFQLISKGNVYSTLFLVFGLIFFFIAVVLATSEYDDLSYFDYKPFIYFGIIIHYFFYYILENMRKKSLAFDLGFSTIGHTKVTAPFRIAISHFCILFFSIGFSFLLSWFNMRLDNSKPEYINANLKEYYSNQNHCENLEFENDIYGTLSFRVCKGRYSFLEKNLSAQLNIKKGAFNLPYAYELSFPNLDNFELYLSSTKTKLQDLRHYQIQHFYKYDQSETFKEKFQSWPLKCEKNENYFCRLSAYIENEKKNKEEEISYLKKGCSKLEFVSCYGLVYNKEFPLEDGQFAIEILQKNCDKDNGVACYNYASALIIKDYKKNKDRINELFSKSCKLSYEQACRNI